MKTTTGRVAFTQVNGEALFGGAVAKITRASPVVNSTNIERKTTQTQIFKRFKMIRKVKIKSVQKLLSVIVANKLDIQLRNVRWTLI